MTYEAGNRYSHQGPPAVSPRFPGVLIQPAASINSCLEIYGEVLAMSEDVVTPQRGDFGR